MTFFPSTSRTPTIAHTPPPTPTPSSTATTVDDAESARPATGDLLDLAFNAQGGRDGPRSGTASEQGRGDAEDEGVVFEGLSLPAVVHEETKTVDTENASVQPSVEVCGWEVLEALLLLVILSMTKGVVNGCGARSMHLWLQRN